jgi:transcriptional regulator with GAF, ATPase, and Fis domain
VSQQWTPSGSTRAETPPSPYDAVAALEELMHRLRRSCGANRVAVWVHEETTEMAVPFRQVLCDTRASGAEAEPLRSPMALSRSPFLWTVVRERRALTVREGDSGVHADELAEYSVPSVHGEPLFLGDQVVGVLVIEPAAAASPTQLRQAVPKLAMALSHAWERRSEQRRLAQAEVLLGLIEGASGARSMEHLLGSACEQLAALSEVERACVFLL